jgi:MFS family permease
VLISILPVRSLLLAIFMLMAGGGVLSTLTSVRLEHGGSNALTIGVVGAAYFAGLILGSLRAPAMIRRAGHIRAFAAFVSLFSATMLVYSLHQGPLLWAGLRFVDGVCIAGVFVCLESWLNERAEQETRGAILAGYMISLYAGQAIGQFLLGLGAVGPALPFVAGSILISLAAIPVLLTRISAPTPLDAPSLSIGRLYAVSPLGVIGAVVTGVMLGAFYTLGAVYARRLGVSLSATATFMSAVILGGVIFQWPLGRLSDRFDRRRIIVLGFAGAVAVSLILALTSSPGATLLVAGGLFGGFGFALYPLCVAHANDHLAPDQRVVASGGLVLLYSIGAAVGPLAGSLAMTAFGPSGLFLLVGGCAAFALAFALWRQAKALPVPLDLQQQYQLLPRTTPAVAALDPLAASPITEDL